MTKLIKDAIQGLQGCALAALYAQFEWTFRGYCSLPLTHSYADMRSQLLRSADAGIEVREVPYHPNDYFATMGELFAALPPDTRKAMEEAGQAPKDANEQALWGRGWFGDVLPGHMNSIAWHPGVQDVQGIQYVSPLPGVEATRLELYRVRGLTDDIQDIEELAAQGDFLSHLRIRALFLGVTATMSNIDHTTLFRVACAFPTPTLAGYVRLYRERDQKPGIPGRNTHLKSASQALFEMPGFIAKRIEQGRNIALTHGGFTLPELFDAPPVQVIVNEVPIEIHFPKVVMIDTQVVDVVGLEAAQGAADQAVEELKGFGIEIPPMTF